MYIYENVRHFSANTNKEDQCNQSHGNKFRCKQRVESGVSIKKLSYQQTEVKWFSMAGKLGICGKKKILKLGKIQVDSVAGCCIGCLTSGQQVPHVRADVPVRRAGGSLAAASCAAAQLRLRCDRTYRSRRVGDPLATGGGLGTGCWGPQPLSREADGRRPRGGGTRVGGGGEEGGGGSPGLPGEWGRGAGSFFATVWHNMTLER